MAIALSTRLYRLLLNACGIAAGAMVGAMTFLVGYDVIARNLGWGNIPWVMDVTEHMLPLATCVAAPWLLYQNMHIRLDVLNMALSSAALARLDRAASVVGLLVSSVITWYSILVIQDSMQSGAVVMKTVIFPEWWVYTPMPFGFGLLAIECLRRLLSGPGQPLATVDTAEITSTHASDRDPESVSPVPPPAQGRR
jgi:TRAP-type C4-dicarboxylate transport system permease small subunit